DRRHVVAASDRQGGVQAGDEGPGQGPARPRRRPGRGRAADAPGPAARSQPGRRCRPGPGPSPAHARGAEGPPPGEEDAATRASPPWRRRGGTLKLLGPPPSRCESTPLYCAAVADCNSVAGLPSAVARARRGVGGCGPVTFDDDIVSRLRVVAGPNNVMRS